MADTTTTEQVLSDDEREQLALAEQDGKALQALIEDLSNARRRRRQFAARVVSLLAHRDPDLVVPYIAELIDALYRPEAQTRWEVLDALVCLLPEHADELDEAFEGAEAALFDELSSTLRLSAFNLLTAWGKSSQERSAKAWSVIDEAIQCYHGDLEYRDMLGYLRAFADGDISEAVASELAGRLQFDAQNGKGSYLKARSSEIYDALVKRFGFEAPAKRSRATAASDDTEGDDEE